MVIPQQLKNVNFRYVLLGEWDSWKNKSNNEVSKFSPELYEEIKKEKGWMPLGKAPFESKWQDNGYVFNNPKLLLHIKEGKNFGVIGGHGNLRILDIDDPNLAKEILEKTDTYTVKTGGGGMHFYFLSDYETNHVLMEERGELRAKNYQVVSAPCQHPSGNFYEVINDVEIQEIPVEDLLNLIKPHLREKLPTTDFKERPKDTSGSGLEYRRVVAMLREGRSKEFIFQEMSNYTKWATHGARFPQYREQTYGNAKKFVDSLPEESEETKEEEKNFELIWEKDLQGYEMDEKEWIIDKLIPTRSVCVLTGKRGTMKTFLALAMSHAVASGEDFLGHFHTKQGGVLYLDKENGIPIMKKRTKFILNGMKLDKDLPLAFICFSQLKIDKGVDLFEIGEQIAKHNIKLLVIDTYRRAISFDENDAGAVSKLFVDGLRPIAEKHNFTILLIHHNRKSGQGSGDEMDEIRGSSDLANYADIILKTERKGNNLVLKQLKNRNAQEEDPMQIGVDFEQEEEILELSFKGAYEKQNRVEQTAEVLAVWFAKEKIKRFTTSDAKEIAFKHGIKETNFKNGLIALCDTGTITKLMRGIFEVN